MIDIIVLLLGIAMGFFAATIWYESRDFARIEVAKYFDPDQPLKLKTHLDDVLQIAAQRQRDELNIQYAHLSADVREVVIDNKMSQLFVEMVNDLEKSIKVVRKK